MRAWIRVLARNLSLVLLVGGCVCSVCACGIAFSPGLGQAPAKSQDDESSSSATEQRTGEVGNRMGSLAFGVGVTVGERPPDAGTLTETPTSDAAAR